MSFTKGHKRRPTSIAADEILSNPPVTPSKNTKEYRAADGSVLQSSMVKSGSPSKRQMRGTPSQVRFSLPAGNLGDDDDEEDEDNEMNINDSMMSDDFTHRSIFNSESKQLQPAFKVDEPRGRTSSRRPLSVVDSMREMLSSSPDRKKLFIRGDTKLNKQSLPIPIELSLPPFLSPENKNKKRPTSLVFNGRDYEPFEIDYYTPQVRKISNLSVPTQETRSKSYSPIKITKKPEPIKQPVPRKAEKPLPQIISKQIEIPSLEKPYKLPLPKPVKENQLDNEKEIEHPSKAAQEQNNQLNKTFAFPSRPPVQPPVQQPVQQQKEAQPQHHQDRSTRYMNQEVDQISRPAPQHQDKGLALYTTSGPIHELPHPNQSQLGRFASPPIQQQQETQEQSELQQQYMQTGYSQPQQPSPNRRHVHRRSKSIIDFPVDKLSEVPAEHHKPKELPLIKTNVQNVRNISDEGTIITPESDYSTIPSAIPTEKSLEDDYDDQLSFDSIQDSLDLAHSDMESLDVQGIKSADSLISNHAEADPEQLLDLGRLILNSRTDADLSKRPSRQIKNKSSTSSSGLINKVQKERNIEPSRSIIRELPPQPQQQTTSIANTTTTPTVNVQKLRGQPLGSQHQPQIVRLLDNNEPERIRQISQKAVHQRSSNRGKYSPNPSQSSYESEISEPFSATSSNQTVETADSIHKGSTTTIDLTNEGFDIISKKDNRNNFEPINDDYKSTFENINGEVRETIILDDDELESITAPLRIRHKRSKSALGNLEFEKSNRAFSNFSFETVASEVQLHYNSNETSQKPASNGNRRPLRTYTDQNRTVIELCDDTMESTKEVLEQLQRQRTILLNKQRTLMRSKNKDEGRLKSIRKLQDDLKKIQPKIQAQAQNPKPKPKLTRPQSYVYGENPMETLQDRQASNPKDYYDYRNNQTYNFETYMRSQSSSTLS